MLDKSPACGWADAYRASRRRCIPPHYFVPWTRAPLHALVRPGETESAGQALAGLGEQGREHGEVRIAAAALRLAQDDPCAATAALEPVLDGPASVNWPTWLA